MTPTYPSPLAPSRARTLLAGLLVTAGLTAAAHALPPTPLPAPLAPSEPWAEALDRHTQSVPGTVGTTVDYEALATGDGAALWKKVLAQLAEASPPRSRDEQLAFWINAYNILAIDTVLRAWPVESIKDVGSFLFPVWRREAGVAAGRTVTLHEVEHEILRPLGDPRIHAAIVCASTSCPSLRRGPFRSVAISGQLDEQMRTWLASPTKGLRVDRGAALITVSQIFDWFEEDFEALGGVPATLTRYAPAADREWLAQHGAVASIEFFEYDWTVNARRP